MEWSFDGATSIPARLNGNRQIGQATRPVVGNCIPWIFLIGYSEGVVLCAYHFKLTILLTTQQFPTKEVRIWHNQRTSVP